MDYVASLEVVQVTVKVVMVVVYNYIQILCSMLTGFQWEYCLCFFLVLMGIVFSFFFLVGPFIVGFLFSFLMLLINVELEDVGYPDQHMFLGERFLLPRGVSKEIISGLIRYVMHICFDRQKDEVSDFIFEVELFCCGYTEHKQIREGKGRCEKQWHASPWW